MGCKRRSTATSLETFFVVHPKTVIGWCCDNGRLFLIWVLCCGFDGLQENSLSAPADRLAQARKTLQEQFMQYFVPASDSPSGSAGTQSPVEKWHQTSLTPDEEKQLAGLAPGKLKQSLLHLGLAFKKAAQLPAFGQFNGVKNGNAAGVGYGSSSSTLPTVNNLYQTGLLNEADFTALISAPALGGSSFAEFSIFSAPRSHVPPTGQARTASQDQLLESSFRALIALVPSLQRTHSGFDCQPPSSINSFLSRSPLLVSAAELLRNGSIEDAAARNGLYEALLELLQKLAEHPATTALVCDEMTAYSSQEQLLHYSFKHTSVWGSTAVVPDGVGRRVDQGRNGKEKEKAAQKTKSLAELISGMRAQCDCISAKASSYQADFLTREGKAMLTLCDRFAKTDDCIASTESARRFEMQRDVVEPHDNRLEQKETAPEAWHRGHCVAEANDEDMLRVFRLCKEVKDAAQGTSAQGRMKRLISEISMMSTALPQGIYVRHGSSRIDVMKALIIGPQGTPYQNGIFEFDLFMPLTYPQVSPMVQFKTTGGGKIRFNPNLYENGHGEPAHTREIIMRGLFTLTILICYTVCLSLLGTWSGQPWKPHESTIMQVLVSLQGMVFCADPWYNEPGFEAQENKRSSQAYNDRIKQYTVEEALLGWLRKLPLPPEPQQARPAPAVPVSTANVTTRSAAAAAAAASLASGSATDPSAAAQKAQEVATTAAAETQIWGDVLRNHFSAQAGEILNTVEAWKGPKRKITTGHLKELRMLMRRHGFLSQA